MGLNRNQGITIGLFLALFLILYFLVPTTPRERATIDEERSKAFSTFDPTAYLENSKRLLPPGLLAKVESLEDTLNSAKAQEQQVEILKQISSSYNRSGNFAAGAIIAEQLAELIQTDTAWSIAGSTYFSGYQSAKDTLLKGYCFDQAILAFESAISINPTEVSHRVNLGLCYVEGGQNPMKGIVMIRELLDSNPDSEIVLFTLGRLSLRTGQYDKAIDRFQTVLKSDPNNFNANYLLAEAYREKGDKLQAIEAFTTCLTLNADPSFQAEVSAIINELRK